MSINSPGVLRLLRICRTVSDIDRAVAFYRDVLDFLVVGTTTHRRDAWSALIGASEAQAQCVILRLGQQELELVAFNPGGAAYPAESGSADLWFQHIAIVVSDIDAAYDRVRAALQLRPAPCGLISTSGPQHLPPNDGSVSACKFRDPDGHPVELIHFPDGAGDPVWQSKSTLFLGIDHSAIAVGDLDSAIDFYSRQLGLKRASHSCNTGTPQDRLDGLRDVVLQVVALLPELHTPHLELLCYRRPAGRPISAHRQYNDIEVDRLVFQVDDLASLLERLDAEQVLIPTQVSSRGIVTLPNSQRWMQIQDPGGHMILLTEGERA